MPEIAAKICFWAQNWWVQIVSSEQERGGENFSTQCIAKYLTGWEAVIPHCVALLPQPNYNKAPKWGKGGGGDL